MRLLFAPRPEHLAGEVFERRLETGNQLVVSLRVGKLGALQPGRELVVDPAGRGPPFEQGDPHERSEQVVLVRVGLRRGQRGPDVGGGHPPAGGHVGDDADDPEALAVGLEGQAERGPAGEQPVARGAIDDRHEAGLGDVARIERPSLEEVEVENAPELGVGPPQLQRDLLPPQERLRGARARGNREAFDAGQVPGVAVEQLVPRPRVPRVVLAQHRRPQHRPGSIVVDLRRVRPERVVEQCRRDGEDDEGEADPEEADQREELPPEEHLPGGLQVMNQHHSTMRGLGACPGVSSLVNSPSARRTVEECGRSRTRAAGRASPSRSSSSPGGSGPGGWP